MNIVSVVSASSILKSSSWLRRAQEVKTPRFSWLAAISDQANAAFMFRTLAIWCAENGLDSLDTLLSRRGELEQQDFWFNLLEVTQTRLNGALDAATVSPAANVAESRCACSSSQNPTPAVAAAAETEPHATRATSQAQDGAGALQLADIQPSFLTGMSTEDSLVRSFADTQSQEGGMPSSLDVQSMDEWSVSSMGARTAPTNQAATCQVSLLATVLDTVDTTGDGLPDSVVLDTTGDGLQNLTRPIEFRAAPQERVAVRRQSKDMQAKWLQEKMQRGEAGVDLTGNGFVDTVALDISGDGHIDYLRPIAYSSEL